MKLRGGSLKKETTLLTFSHLVHQEKREGSNKIRNERREVNNTIEIQRITKNFMNNYTPRNWKT